MKLAPQDSSYARHGVSAKGARNAAGTAGILEVAGSAARSLRRK